jgi:hypothetical protein
MKTAQTGNGSARLGHNPTGTEGRFETDRNKRLNKYRTPTHSASAGPLRRIRRDKLGSALGRKLAQQTVHSERGKKYRANFKTGSSAILESFQEFDLPVPRFLNLCPVSGTFNYSLREVWPELEEEGQ